MSAGGEYWQEAFELAFEAAGVWHLIERMPREQRAEIGESLATSAEHQSLAFYTPENPMIAENKRLSAKLNWERELEVCMNCCGAGRLEYSTGPWAVNTGCHVCNGSGKIHPRREREPA